MLDSLVLPSLAVLSAAWALVSLARRQRAIAAGAFTTALTLALAATAAHLGLGPWLEGGYGMGVLALCGGYALGAAVASRFSTSDGPRRAALVGAVVTLAASGAFYAEAVRAVAEAVRHAEPATAALITNAGEAEARRLLELAAILGALTAALLFGRQRPRRDPGRVGAGARLDGERRHDQARLFAS
ncbi:MAG: hypothetical protein ACOZQL_30940 [Myxococcota bacterium]